MLVSCVVHAGIVIGMPQQGRASERSAPQPVWFELQVGVSSPAAHAPREPPEAVSSVNRDTRELQHAPSPRRERSVQSRPAQVAEALAPPVELAADAIKADAVVDADQAAPSRQRAAIVDLSPHAAARTLSDSTFISVRDSGVPREERPLSPEADEFAKQGSGLRASKEAERTGEGGAVDAVEDALYNVLRPWKLLSKTMRGSEYRYTGGGFDAAILPDGRVRFRDKDGPVLTGMVTQPGREGEIGADLPPGAAWGASLGDPRAVWHRIRGKDPHAAERQLFLERTRTLREYLAGRANERGTPPERRVDASPKEPQPEPSAPR
jgi:hypothetical protein